MKLDFPKRWLFVAFFAGAATAAGVTAVAHVGPPMWAQHHELPADATPAEVEARVGRLLEHVYLEIDVSDAQKAQIQPLVVRAVSDLLPLREKFRGGHGDAIALLTAERVDRAAIEAVRVDKLAAADEASRVFAQLIGDIADVLTPEQRRALAVHVASRHAPRHGG